MDDSKKFDSLIDSIRGALDTVHHAREIALPECRRAIRASGLAIRAVHLGQSEVWEARLEEAKGALVAAQSALEPFPEIASAGFLHDAEKEVAEAHLTFALAAGEVVPDAGDIGVRIPAWLNGLAEAASELRRAVLDRLRSGQTEEAERLFASMDSACDMLMTIDYPDAITGGLRRTVDALRAVVERTRADLTVTLIQENLQSTLLRQMPGQKKDPST